ncbi:MAG: hypothetical protein LBQ93_09805 [Treponema sp.]|nr:hypothetical protein [Treponema sp.]
MKFKYLIIVISIVIIIVILATALLPLLLAEPEFAVNLQQLILPLLIFIALLLICISLFFIINYRLFSLLEREDWPALSFYLEQKIYVKGRYSAQNVRLLASSYLVTSDFSSVLKLEGKAMLAKPSVVDKNVLVFGAARILSGSQKDAANFFKKYMGKGNNRDKQWIHWFFGFSQLLGGVFSVAEQEFSSLAVSSDNALITGLSAFFLGTSVLKRSQKPEECRFVVENSRGRLIKALKNINNWKKEADRSANEIHVAIIRKYIDEAGKWLFQPPAVRQNDAAENTSIEETSDENTSASIEE